MMFPNSGMARSINCSLHCLYFPLLSFTRHAYRLFQWSTSV